MAKRLSREELEQRMVEIEKRLENLPKHLVVGFAARVATYSLPGLTENYENREFLWFWKETARQKYLLAVFRALNITWCASLQEHIRFMGANAINTADILSAISANSSANAADIAYAVHIAYAATYTTNPATNAANVAIYAANSNFTQHELNLISSDNYLSQPLHEHPQTKQFIQQLKKIKFDYWADWYQDRLNGKPLALELLEKSVFLPDEIKSKSPREINVYLKSLRTAKQPLNKIRVFFIGHGAAGKTSLVRVLHGEKVVEGEEKMTCGIEIREWSVPNSEIKAHFWDFGGQVMAHATHQFFLRSRCVYVLVLDARSDVNANMQAEYWLEHVRAFGNDAPVLIVGNKADLAQINLNFNSLKEKFENIVDFYPVSCTKCQAQYKPEFDRFLRDFTAKITETVEQQQIYFTDAHFSVLTELKKFTPARAFLPETKFHQICNRSNVAKEGDLNRYWLLKLLDDLGMIIHFEKIKWTKAYVLNPHWLTYGVYTVLYEDKTKRQQGRVTLQDVYDFLNQHTVKTDDGVTLNYPIDRCQFIIEAMEQFKLCYCVDSKDKTYVIPDLLPSDRPKDLNFDKQSALAFDFDFEGLLPRHLIANLIVRHHHEIYNKLVWQNGVLLNNQNFQARALVEADYYNRRFSLWISGSGASRYFSVLHNDIIDMLQKMEKLQYEEWIVLPERYKKNSQNTPRVPFRTLLANERKGNRVYTCEYGDIEIAEVLKIMPKNERDEIPVGITINANNSPGQNIAISKTQSRLTQVAQNSSHQDTIQQFDEKLKTLQVDIRTDVEDESLRKQLLNELRALREAVENLQKTGIERKEAQKTLQTFSQRLKDGSSKLMSSLNQWRENTETLQWLQDGISNLLK
jgi:small GTP-binding protein